MAIEIVSFPSYKIVIFHSYVDLPEGSDFSRKFGWPVLDGPKSRQKEVMKMETSGICVWFILVDFLLVSTSARRKSEEKNSWKNLSQERRYASFTKVGPPAFFGLRSSSQFQHKRRDPKRSINKYIYIYINIYIYICMYVYVYTSVSAGWCEQPPWNPKFSEREQLLGGTQKNFHANCLDHGWIKLFLAFFCYGKTWKTPAIFQLQMYYRVIYQVLSTTKQSAHSTPKYSISLWSSPCFLSAKTAKSSWVVHTFLVNVGVIETVNCWPFHWKIYG